MKLISDNNNKAFELKKGAWSPEEDQKLLAYITKSGISNWTKIPISAGLSRSGKSCRLRWLNYLRPGVRRGNFTPEEIIVVMQAHELFGNKWSKIASFLNGRTDNEVKNFWHTYIRKSIKSGNGHISGTLQDRPNKKLKQHKEKKEMISSPESSSGNSSTITMESIDFPIMESYSPNEDCSTSEESADIQNMFAEPFTIEDEEWLFGMNNSSSLPFFDENITWESLFRLQDPLFP